MAKTPDKIWATFDEDVSAQTCEVYAQDTPDGFVDKPTEYVSRAHCEALVAAARANALREAAGVCTHVTKTYVVMKPDKETYEPMRVQEAAKGMVRLARQDIEALIPENTND